MSNLSVLKEVSEHPFLRLWFSGRLPLTSIKGFVSCLSEFESNASKLIKNFTTFPLAQDILSLERDHKVLIKSFADSINVVHQAPFRHDFYKAFENNVLCTSDGFYDYLSYNFILKSISHNIASSLKAYYGVHKKLEIFYSHLNMPETSLQMHNTPINRTARLFSSLLNKVHKTYNGVTI